MNLELDPLPFEDESIDVVMTNQVLEHVKEIFWILHQASRVLRVGGSMVIGVPNLASFHNRLLLLFGKQPTVIQNHSAHLRGYTRHDILRMFEMIFPGGYRLEDFGARIFTRCHRSQPAAGEAFAERCVALSSAEEEASLSR